MVSDKSLSRDQKYVLDYYSIENDGQVCLNNGWNKNNWKYFKKIFYTRCDLENVEYPVSLYYGLVQFLIKYEARINI